MKRLFAIVLLMFVSMSAAAAEKPLGMEEFTSLGELAKKISSYFPKVQGEVKTAQGTLLTIALGTKDGLKSGVVLSLWRDGKEILHPVTKAVIGRAEDEVGEAEVVKVGETSSTARLIKKLKDPKPGDKARITPKKIGLALVPLRPDRPDVVQGLGERLNELGRFSVLENEKAAAFLKERKQRDSSLIKEMGRSFGLDVVAAVELFPSEGGKLLITVRMFYADDARPLDTITAMLDLASKTEALGEIRPFFAPVREEKTVDATEKSVSPNLPFEARQFALADLDGTGALQYVFSDGSKLHVYRRGPSEWRKEWSEPGSFAAGEVQHINLDVADINGNGRPEIFVTAMRNEKVVSSVLEFQDGAYRRIAEVPGFLRVITYPGKGNILIGQGYDPASFFTGKPGQYVWSDGKYVPGPEISLPKGVDLYGFVVADMGEARPLVTAFNDKEQLVVYSSDNAIWKSEEKYPAIGITVSKPLTGIDAVVLKGAAESGDKRELTGIQREKARIKGRLLALDLNGDGRDEIILPKNSGFVFGGSKESEVVSFSWTGARLDQRLKIKDVPGRVLDFQILRQQGGGAQIFALVNTPGGLFKSDTLRVMSYTVK
jgi:hypothetical protein